MSPNDKTVPLAASNEKVITPGGPRDPSRVHLVEEGVQLQFVGDQIHLVREDEVQQMIDLDPPIKEPYPGDNGWVAYSRWNNNTGYPILSFTTTWIVPPAPTTQSGQTIYLFTGLQTRDKSGILQSALQWGPSLDDGGNFWGLVSWYVGGGRALHSKLTKVKEGDVLVAEVWHNGQSGGKFNYTASFANIPSSRLQIRDSNELTWAVETLEAWGITRCSEYPANNHIIMSDINLRTTQNFPDLKWDAFSTVHDCGQNTVIAVDGSMHGSVDLIYCA